MKILLAADGSRFTKKALAFLVVNDLLGEQGSTLRIINVQTPLPPHVTRQLSKAVVDEYQRDLAEKVINPIRRFVSRHAMRCEVEWVVGSAVEEIVKAARKYKSQLIVMGTHGDGLLGRIVLGSVAQRVLAASPVPVLLVN